VSERFLCRRRAENPIEPKYRDNLDWWREDNTCSYCGSLNPDEVIRLIEIGSCVTPTDKSYKIYLGDNHKAYFQHFSQSHADRFIGLYNAKKMRIAEPGYFYVRPFFAAPAQQH